MGKLAVIFKKELAGYSNSAIAYVFLIVFALLNSGLFMTQFFLASRADMRAFFLGLPFVLCVFLPAVSMRLWAEEKRGNTHELLLTFPIKPYQLVLGKFFASFAFYGLALLCTLPVPIMLAVLGNPDLGAILSGYVGAMFLGGLFLAIGILISGFYRDQIVAFILSMTVCFGVYLIGTEFIAALIDGWIVGAGTFLRRTIGAADHFWPFCKGVIDNRDIIYFLLGGSVCLMLNGFWIEGRMRPRARSIFTSAALLCAGIFLLANWFFIGSPIGRFDLTDGQLYTISKTSKKILRGLQSPVFAKLYISSPEKMPTSMKTLEQDIRDKLDELRLASDGHFQYKVFHMDPAKIEGENGGNQPEETLEQQLSQKGIQPFQVESIQTDELGVRLVYSALSLSYQEKPDEILPRVYAGNLDELEYMILSKIYRMTLPEIPKVALVAPYEDRSLDPNLVALLEQLGASGQIPESYREDPYETLEMSLKYEGYPFSRFDLSKSFAIPEGTKTLIMIEPRELTAKQKFEINKFVYEGGSLFLAVQNYKFNYRPTKQWVELVPQEEKPEVNDLLNAWGVAVDPQVLADEQSEAINLSQGRGALFDAPVPVKLPIQILLTAAEMNKEVSITSRLQAIFYLWGNALKIDDAKIKTQRLKVETLLHSSDKSWTVPFKPGQMSLDNLNKLPQSPKGPFPLSIYAYGQFADAYPDQAELADEDLSAETEPIAGAEPAKKALAKENPEPLKPAPGKMILIGDAMLFQKQLFQGGGHLNFFLNSVDILTLGDELIGIRSKMTADRTLPKISQAAKMVWRVFTTLLVPFLIAIAGIAHFYFRRRFQQQYLKNLSKS